MTKHYQIAVMALIFTAFAVKAADTQKEKVLDVAPYMAAHGLSLRSVSAETRALYAQVFSHLGVDYRLVVLPYLRSIQMAAAGHVDVVLVYDATFGELAIKSRPEGIVPVSVAHAKHQLLLLGPSSAASSALGAKVGMPRYFPSAERFMLELGYEPLLYDTYESLFRSVKAGRIDSLLISRIALDRISSAYDKEGDLTVVRVLGCASSYLGFSVAALGQERAEALAKQSAIILRDLKAQQFEHLRQDC